MHHRLKILRKGIDIVVLVALLLSLPGTSMLPTLVQAREAQPEFAPAPDMATEPAPAAQIGLFRTRVALRQVTSRARLDELGIVVLDEGEDWAVVLVDDEQLETLARLRFEPRRSENLETLIAAHAETASWLAQSLQPQFDEITGLRRQIETGEQSKSETATQVHAILHGITPEQQAGIASLISVDTDGDGLTDTEESWWCTDPNDPNSDGDAAGYSDGEEVAALLEFTLPRNVRWGYGAPFGPPNAWPDFNGADGNPDTPACNDGDFDTIPDYAEAYVIGLRVPAESTDGDKFDDGQEFFGVTYCPGAPASCGYGIYPRIEYWSYIQADMPSWVEPPGDNPFVAAFPEPEINVTPGSWHVERVTVITTEQGEIVQTEHSYATSALEGQSSSMADTVTWNEWEEVSEAVETPLELSSIPKNTVDANLGKVFGGVSLFAAGTIGGAAVCAGSFGLGCAAGAIVGATAANVGWDMIKEGFADQNSQNVAQTQLNINNYDLSTMYYDSSSPYYDMSSSFEQNAYVQMSQQFNNISLGASYDGVHYALNQQGQLLAQGLHDVAYAISQPRYTETRTNGRSWGGAQTTTHEVYEEHTITEGEAFTTGEQWSTAWAVDSSHAADLTFEFTVENTGTEYARELTGMIVNVFIGDDTSPAISYPAWEKFPGGTIQNLFPGDRHTFTSDPIPLSLEEMKRIDLGERLTVVVEDYSFGADELFYENAVQGGVTVFIEDGIEDGDETVDSYVIPTWGVESVLDVMTRYFPAGYDMDGNLNALWTPEFDETNPPTWTEHYLSDIAWWNVYLTQAEGGGTPLQDLPAQADSAILFRFNRDSDRDGYNDRAEFRYYCGLPAAHSEAVHCADAHLLPEVHPQPEVLAGYVVERVGDVVTVKLAVENNGTFDAYGIDAVMYAPDDTVSIGNNTVGGNGRARPGEHVAVGSLVKAPDLTAWGSSTADPYAGGNYIGTTDRVYTFTVSTPGVVGQAGTAIDWTDGLGGNGTLDVGSAYHAPLPLDVADGLQVGLNTGNALAGTSFTVQAFTPRDTFTYTINSEPFTEPVIVVSYSDPQGSHRFVTPVEMTALGESLAVHSGAMEKGLALQIVTTESVTASVPNTLHLNVSSPATSTIENGHLYLNFVADGALMAELPYTLTIPTGPTVMSVTWSTDVFSETYDPEADNLLIAFWTDYEGNIVDAAARPLNTFQADPQPTFAMAPEDMTWDFGTARQGTLMQRQFELANVGYMDLLTYLGEVTGVTVVGPASGAVLPADMAVYTVTLNTEYLPVGAFEETIPIRTSDPANPTQTVTIRGEVLPFTPDSTQDVTLRPLDWAATIPGDHSQGEWVTFTHTLGPDPETLHPIKVYDQDYTTLWGVGKYATDFGQGTASSEMFGNGNDGDRNYTTSMTINAARRSVTADVTVGQSQLTTDNVTGLTQGTEILIIQMRGTGHGNYEFAHIDAVNGNEVTVSKALVNSYYASADNAAQILEVPQYGNVTVNAGVIISPPTWNGSTGGVLIFRANGQVVVNGTISASGRGFPGGFTSSSAHAEQGDSATGSGTTSTSRNGTGGGGGALGDGAAAGGGGGGGLGSAGNSGQPGARGSGAGGTIGGNAELTNVIMGGGGGGGGYRGDTGGGTGGISGGIILAAARQLTLGGSAAIESTGNVGGNKQSGDGSAGGGGGGAGGSILLKVETGTLGDNLVAALGGNGGAGRLGSNNDGGAGGVGRIRVEYCESISGTTNPSASKQELDCYIVEQVESSPYDTTQLNIPESITDSETYKIQYGRRYTFPSAGEKTLHIRMPKQLYTSLSLDALLSNTGVSSGDLNLALDVGNDGINDWVHNATADFPVTFVITDVVDSLNAYLVSRTDIAWDADVDVPVRVTSNRQADVILTNLELRLQYNQPAGLLSEVDTSADRPLDWNAYIAGNHSQGEWITFTHTLGPDKQSLHPVKVYSYDYATLWGVGKYATNFSEGTASADMFGDGRDGVMPSSGNLDNNNGFGLMSVTGTQGSTTVNVIDRYAGWRINPGDTVLIHQTQLSGAGYWEFNEALSNFTGTGTFSLSEPLEHSYGSGAQIMRVPQYTDCNVTGTVTPLMPWEPNAKVGGIFAVQCSGEMVITGAISANGYGHKAGYGGDENPGSNPDTGCTGGSYTGPLIGGSSSASMSPPGPENGGGGRGGRGRRGPDRGAGGGGASYGSSGTYGESVDGVAGGTPGLLYGTPSLDMFYLGSGGGGGGKAKDGYGGDGGHGGGGVFIFANALSVSGSILANGNGAAEQPTGIGGGGGGGSGGSIWITAGTGQLGSARVRATGGGGRDGDLYGGHGGSGGVGRIHVEHCNELTGSTSPSADVTQLSCYITEQLESDPYDTTRLILPEALTDGQTYAIQYGRRYVFPSAGEQTGYLQLRRQMYGSVSLDALVSNTDVSNGVLDLCLDIGDDGTCNYTHNASIDFPAELVAADLASALNDYLVSRSDIAWGDPVDVPVRVAINRQADVILTNLALNPVGTKTRYLRLPAQDYADLHVSLQFTQPGVPNGPLAFAVDIGADGDTDWYYSGTPDFPAVLESPNLADAFNTYLAGRNGDVDVPLRIIPNPFIDTALYGMTAIPVETPDATLTAADITFGAPVATEGEHMPISLTLHNDGGLDTAGLTAAFFAAAPGWGEWYVGSAYVPGIPAGLTATTTITWNTLGFTGTVPVRVVVDPYDRVSELDEENNEATTTFEVRTRPDLLVEEIALSDEEPMAGETVTVSLTLRNQGQTTSAEQTLSLYQGNPDDGGTPIAQLVQPSLTGGLTATVTIAWAPPDPGPYRLFVVVDEDDAVAEYDESNNERWHDVYVGFPSPLLLNSGTAEERSYSSEAGYGAYDPQANDVAVVCGGGSAVHETLRRDPNGEVLYRFDHLLPGHFYHLDVTLYECDGAGRQESVYVNGHPIAGPEDLGDGQVHRLSLRLDPALYSGHAVSVTIAAPGVDGAVVSEVNLHDIDYRYADAGGSDDPQYPAPEAELAYGWLDTSVASTGWGALPFQTVRVDQNDAELRYRFDGLEPNKRYNVHFTFWQPSGTERIEKVRIDGIDTGLVVDTGDTLLHRETVTVLPAVYADDGSITVSILRRNASTGALVNEIALEEETRSIATACNVPATPFVSFAYGAVDILAQGAPAGTIVEAMSPRGDVVGCFVVGTPGQYGAMAIYGEDTSTNTPGMRAGELVEFRVSGIGAKATPQFIWQDDGNAHRADLVIDATNDQMILMAPGYNLISFNVDPVVPLPHRVLSYLEGRYDRVLGETGAYIPGLPDVFNTLHELRPGLSYYIYITNTTSLNALIEGATVPVTTPLPLHAGWNWIGYLPETTLPITVALQSVEGNYQRVRSLTQFFDPDIPEFSTLQEMEPGQGYMLYANTAVTLTYPADAGATMVQPQVDAASRCAHVAPTPKFTLLYGYLDLNGAPVPAGSLVEAVTPDGEVAGCEVVRQPGLVPFVHLYGADDSVNPPVPGFREGGAITLRVDGVPIAVDLDLHWQDDWDTHRISAAGDTRQLYLPIVTRGK